ncbi:Uncharacterized protein PECH_008762 [Penicillium ucsense]|uniref:F-box domain-containing protein n=1 Tax=Penicillium ucsense TaxID=2839758 RepID=A0A8J8W2Z8_9EURO|nr:Uncharacterized protein PECM_008375 [Penicillium ucsense]KAF7733365.1 Uncharacterized protein PECH_008762 [Penicillium ucsense]
MVSSYILPSVRYDQDSKTPRNKSAVRPPPPLKLEGDRVRAQMFKDLSQRTPRPKGVRARVKGSSKAGQNKDKRVNETQEVPIMMEVPLAQAAGRTDARGSIQNTPPRSSERRKTKGKPISRQDSLRTIVVLKSPDSSDTEESDISSISDAFPVARSKSSRVLSRFFPELSNNFGIVSPMSSNPTINKQGSQPPEYSSILESELHERVQALYKSSSDADDSSSSVGNFSLEHKTESSSGSDEPGDDASSCYSRRSSITSVESNCFSATKSLTTYSICSPAAAGVFDDFASTYPSRPSSVKSRRLSAISQAFSPSSGLTGFENPRTLLRRASTGSSLSFYDVRNKPLPLEPVEEPSPLEVRRHRGNSISTTRPSSPSSTAHGGENHHDIATVARAYQQPQELDTQLRPRFRRGPTLDEAAEELEDALADLVRSPPLHQQSSLVQGPLQISRHHGDLIATRPAPLPPTTKPHSQTRSYKPFTKSKSLHFKAIKSVDHANQTGASVLRPFRSARDKRSRWASDKDDRHRDLAGAEDAKPQPPLQRSSETVEQDHDGKSTLRTEATSHSLVEPVKSPKSKKSFSMKMLSFRRANQPPGQASASQEPRPGVMLTSRSESSLVDPHQPTEGDAQPDGPPQPQRLSSRAHAKADEEVDGSKANKKKDGARTRLSRCDDLRLQLPRLQTGDLALELDFTLRSSDKESLPHQSPDQQQLRPQPKQPPASQLQLSPLPLERSDKTRSPTMTSFCAPGPTLPVHHRHHAPAPTVKHKVQFPAVNLRIFPPEDEKILVASEIVASEKLRHSQAFISTAQASSVQLPPEQIFELAATPPSPTSSIPSIFQHRPCAPVHFPGEMPEHLVSLIMERIDSLDDLFNFVLVNKRFYQIFKRRELFFLKTALFRMSPPAWEMREMSPPWDNEWQLLVNPDTPVVEYTPKSYLDRYANDIYTLAQLKSMILVRCSPFLRRETVKGLSGVDMTRAEEVDDAFWRIWTFCCIFGNGKGRENDIEGQMNWLKGGTMARNSFRPTSTVNGPFGLDGVLFEPPEGFARGNGASGLSAQQLYDMTEIWTCLGVLLQPLHGQCAEARNVGVFEGHGITAGDVAQEEVALEEWTSFIMTLGLSAVLALSSLCPAEASSALFSRAESRGLTKWEPTANGISRSSFLKEAVSRVYDEKERLKPSISLQDMKHPHDESLQRRKQFQEQLRTGRRRGHSRHESAPLKTFADERPMSEFSTILSKLEEPEPRKVPLESIAPSTYGNYTYTHDCTVPQPPSHPSLQSPSHLRSRSLTSETTFRSVFTPPPPRTQVQDPVDRALTRMVNELGFNPEDAKWALKITDTGEGIDIAAAEKLLKQQKRKNDRNPFAPKGKDGLLKSVMKRKGSNDSGWRFA